MLDEITLHGFETFDSAEPARLMFIYHGTSFINDRITLEEWPALRDTGFSEFDLIPVLSMDGLSMAGAYPILLYISRKLGYYPQNVQDEYFVDSTCEFISHISKFFIEMKEKDMDWITRFSQEKLPNLLKKIENTITKNNDGNGWFLGDHITLVDFVVFDFMWNFLLKPGKIEAYGLLVSESSPKVMGWACRMIKESPSLAKYI
ncbi:unnamed protein product [Blepharisma stoltei]|uniref:Glutathione S-transferase n=1 Tax=Blepharisma stoltei TaxID=1481888 RepID=A0AAU9K7E7_9CILI|nr:unnamed protein product [Blepharisma stoltei]